MVQQFQSLKSGQKENKTDYNSPTMEGEKKINERINKIEEMIKRACKMEDLMDFQSPSLFPNVRLPPKFKMPTLDKFDETSYPKSHLKMYMRVMQPLGSTEELLAQMFQNTLTGAALRWFLNLDNAIVRSWENICREFHNQYKYNIEVDVTRRVLETTKQESKESFSTFITKWKPLGHPHMRIKIKKPLNPPQIQTKIKKPLSHPRFQDSFQVYQLSSRLSIHNSLFFFFQNNKTPVLCFQILSSRAR